MLKLVPDPPFIFCSLQAISASHPMSFKIPRAVDMYLAPAGLFAGKPAPTGSALNLTTAVIL
ncbi:hypothetical protein IAE37_001053 [Pseudomonas sp. S31]|uniref:hypothetical protein n=1 Tax=Pseudomonas sp. S31 TaxID=1564473 RepID=UPI0019144108|nr:hypothetical protein [Pseudomonas sp. S31]MBK4998777.1 hypothetical protein [Pseudomonas sp. S31]